MLRASRELLVVLLLCLLGAVIFSWPLIAELDSLPGPWTTPDIHVGVWLPWQVLEQLKAGEPLLYSEYLYYPEGMDITLHVWNLAIQALQIPFYLVAEPLPAYNLSIIFLAALNGLGGYVLGKTIGGRAGGIAGAVILLTSSYAWNELAFGRGEQGLLAFAALFCAGLYSLKNEPRIWVAVGAGLALGVVGLSYWFYAYFFGLAAVVVCLGWLISGQLSKKKLAYLALAGLVSGLTVAPAAIPILLRAAESGSAYQRATDLTSSALLHSTNIRSFFSLGLLSTFAWPSSQFPQRLQNGIPFIGTALLLLSLFFSGARKKAGFLPMLAIAGIVLGMGRSLQLRPAQMLEIGNYELLMPMAFLDWLPGLRRFWWPHRFLAFTFVGMAGAAAALAAAIPNKRWRAALVALLSLALLLEARAMFAGAPYTVAAGNPEHLEIPPLMRELAKEPGQHPILQLPLRQLRNANVIFVPYHMQPIAGGLAYGENSLASPAFIERIAASPALSSLERAAVTSQLSPVPGAADELRQLGYHYVMYCYKGEHGQDAWIRAYSWFLGSEPDWSDENVAVWNLQGES